MKLHRHRVPSWAGSGRRTPFAGNIIEARPTRTNGNKQNGEGNDGTIGQAAVLNGFAAGLIKNERSCPECGFERCLLHWWNWDPANTDRHEDVETP